MCLLILAAAANLPSGIGTAPLTAQGRHGHNPWHGHRICRVWGRHHHRVSRCWWRQAH